jgi:hypothetical protein
MASLSDQVRDYVYRNYIVPARKIKTASVTVTAGDVHQALEFKNRMSLVCDALDAVKFHMQCGIYLIQRDGPSTRNRQIHVFCPALCRPTQPRPPSRR